MACESFASIQLLTDACGEPGWGGGGGGYAWWRIQHFLWGQNFEGFFALAPPMVCRIAAPNKNHRPGTHLPGSWLVHHVLSQGHFCMVWPMPTTLPWLELLQQVSNTDSLSLQVELLQQAAVNRPRLYSVLEKAAADVPDRQAQAEKCMRSEEYVRAYMLVCSLWPNHPQFDPRVQLSCARAEGLM